jgi:PhoH-like ATPase
MSKIFVIDTSTLVYDPQSFKSFEGNTVIIPITVLEELDKLKKFYDETGKNARTFIRTLDDLLCGPDVKDNVITLDNNITLKIEHNIQEDKSLGSPLYGDNRILSCAIELSKKNKSDKVILISKDIALRIRAKVLGIHSEDYVKDKYDSDEIYNSAKTIVLDDEQVNYYYNHNNLILDDCEIKEYGLNANDFAELKSGDTTIGQARFNAVKKELKEIKRIKSVFGIAPKSLEQAYALDLLLDPDISLVSMAGPSGTGKTMLSLAAALNLLLEKHLYEKLIIMKPIISVGKDLGTLPGSKSEKLDPFLQSFMDNLSFLIKNTKNPKSGKQATDPYLALLMESGAIELEAISYLRGRSLPNSLIIVDECQNLSIHELKTIVTRIGIDSKLILIGDISQIDNMHLDSSNNALLHAIEKFKNHPICGNVLLRKGERSELATLASNIL